ncbi:hypothetical protein [Salipaludibacillus sp. CF4.18]|uniref:hypothetical protein n=1 Tax=Salipaludibacillus sp. CF4.18 TaxID=3373081 RepID=UPI003EE5F212
MHLGITSYGFASSLFALLITKFAMKAFERIEKKQHIEDAKVEAIQSKYVPAIQR